MFEQRNNIRELPDWTGKNIYAALAVIFVVAGIVLVAAGATGGITYKDVSMFFGVDAQNQARGGGVIFIGLGIMFARWHSNKKQQVPGLINKEDIGTLGIKIMSPQDGDRIERQVDVKGTIEKGVPPGFEIRLLRHTSGGGFAIGARVDVTGKEWVSHDFIFGGKSRDRRKISVCLVGPDGRALLDTWRQGAEILDRTRHRCDGVELMPPMFHKTSDLHECHAVEVERI